MTKLPENHTLHNGTYTYTYVTYIWEYPPPPEWAAVFLEANKDDWQQKKCNHCLSRVYMVLKGLEDSHIKAGIAVMI